MTPQQILDQLQNEARGLISNTITYYNRYDVDFTEWDWREAIEKDLRTFLQAFIEAEIARLTKRDNAEMFIGTDEQYVTRGFNQAIDDQITHLKKLITNIKI